MNLIPLISGSKHLKIILLLYIAGSSQVIRLNIMNRMYGIADCITSRPESCHPTITFKVQTSHLVLGHHALLTAKEFIDCTKRRQAHLQIGIQSEF